MTSLILRTATRYLMALLLLFSFFLLLRGHDLPGGGFVGGLVAGLAYSLYALAHDAARTREALPIDPVQIFGVGLLVSIVAALVPIFVGRAFFTALWGHATLPIVGTVEPGTPILFDIGVYLVVVGAIVTIVLHLHEEEEVG